MLTRRDLMKLGLVGSGSLMLPHGQPLSPVGVSFAEDAPSSPRTTPFVDRLPLPPRALTIPDLPPDVSTEHQDFIGDLTRFHRIVAEERVARFTGPASTDFPQNGTLIWGYRDDSDEAETPWPCALGPTFANVHGYNRRGAGLLVRQVNRLPTAHRGFGVPYTTVHLHGGHHPARSDGFPTDIEGFPPFVTKPGGHFDHCYPLLDCGFIDHEEDPTVVIDPSERPSTLWYHDHLIDFTAANVYRGLVGVSFMFDEFDSDDEDDPNADAFHLPSEPFDIPLVLHDKRFNRDGSLWYNSFDHDGFLGDKFLVNGVIQPYHELQRRKYRFRVLNGSNARIYRLYLTNALGQTFPMTQIATEGGLLSFPIPNVHSFMVAPAERVEVIVDFGDALFDSQQTLFLENRLAQDEGRKPDGIVSRGTQLLRFNLVGEKVDDPSRLGREEGGKLVLRRSEPTPAQDLQDATVRTFEFGRSSGAWTINDRLAGDLERSRVRTPRSKKEIWRLVNKSGGWWHPIHIHHEFCRVLRRNGRIPPLAEQDGVGKKDTILLKDNETVEVCVQFRDYRGPFVFHCHNLEHEDMAMMTRYDVV
jgi:FtsP/CotA-like multicopper oxidase with cupredoxin domain